MTLGASAFGLGYGIPLLIGIGAAFASYQGERSAEPYIALVVPLGGPLITGALLDASDTGWGFVGVASGSQVLGLAMLGLGAAVEAALDSPVRATAGGLAVTF